MAIHISPYLMVVQKPVRFLESLVNNFRRCCGKPAKFQKGPHGEGDVPELRAVVALHFQSALVFPEVVGHALQMPLERVSLRIIAPGGDHVQYLADRSDGQIGSAFILVLDQFPHPGQSRLCIPVQGRSS